MLKIISVIFIGLLINCASNKTIGSISISFKNEKDRLPAKIIIDEPYYDKTGDIFFLNRDYMNTYTDIIEYDLRNKTVKKTIFCNESVSTRINEFAYDKDYIVWASVIKGDTIKADIYSYGIYTGNFNKIKEGLICGGASTGMFPISLTVDNGLVSWIEHDFDNKSSTITTFDLQFGKITSAMSLPFIAKAPMGFPTFFINRFNGFSIHDKQLQEGGVEVISQGANDSTISSFRCPDDILFNYTGIYNHQNEYCVLYGKSSKLGDNVYVYDYKTSKCFPIIGFDKNSNIYDDKLRVFGKEILYSVQLNTTGAIADHYYSEIYNLNTMKMTKYERGIDIVKTDKYLALLRINKVNGINQIDFELYENK